MEEMLKKHGFIQSNLFNEFTKGKTYKIIISKNEKSSITHYSPNFYRFLWSKNFDTKKELEKELKENHNN